MDVLAARPAEDGVVWELGPAGLAGYGIVRTERLRPLGRMNLVAPPRPVNSTRPPPANQYTALCALDCLEATG